MTKQNFANKKNTWVALLCIVIVLGIVILLENLSGILPEVPSILKPTSQLFTVLKKGAVYSLVAVSMNLLNGFTGLFSLGQAGFMLLGAYTYAILTVPMAAKDQVYYLFGGSAVKFSLPDAFGSIFGTTGAGGAVSLILGVLVAIILAGCVAAIFAWLIGLPVLRLKSDYLAIATLGFAEIIRAIFQWQRLGPVTNGANMLKNFPIFSSFNIENADGDVVLRLSTFVPFLVAIVCIVIIIMLINSSYGRAFKAIREDEIAAEAMGINLAKHKQLSFCISSFFAGVGGALFAMYATNAQAKPFTSTMTYEILLIVVIGGIGSISGSCIATFLYVACSEWWLRFLDSETALETGSKVTFNIVFAVVVIAIVALIFITQGKKGKKLVYTPPSAPNAKKRKKITWSLLILLIVGIALVVWDIVFAFSANLTLPLLRNGFRMVVFSFIIMIVVLFFRRGIMGDKEITDLFRKRRKKKAAPASGEEAAI
ncbi:MAG: branched-chain amino acid ABC transporter permease [Oscillospiraceae bacterium]|nr:branched-chain amino acid ABC transporter permease [Oscillospiraceae bacterium]